MWVLIFQIWVLIFKIWVLKWMMAYMGIKHSIFWSINEEEFKEWHSELISPQTTLFMAVLSLKNKLKPSSCFLDYVKQYIFQPAFVD